MASVLGRLRDVATSVRASGFRWTATIVLDRIVPFGALRLWSDVVVPHEALSDTPAFLAMPRLRRRFGCRAREAAGLAERCQVVGGNFFEAVPTGADAYLMRHIIHDWDDDKAAKILQNVHRAMSKEGRLLVVEGVIPSGNEPCFGKLLDLTMLVIPGGKERTEAEYRKLFEAGGFQLTRIVPTPAEVSVIEGRKT